MIVQVTTGRLSDRSSFANCLGQPLMPRKYSGPSARIRIRRHR